MDSMFVKNESGSTHVNTVFRQLLAYAVSGGRGRGGPSLSSFTGTPRQAGWAWQRGPRALCSPVLQGFIIPRPVSESFPPLGKEGSRNHDVVSIEKTMCFIPRVAAWNLLLRG